MVIEFRPPMWESLTRTTNCQVSSTSEHKFRKMRIQHHELNWGPGGLSSDTTTWLSPAIFSQSFDISYLQP